MKIETSHHIDASEPDADGFHSYHYEYDVYLFSDGDTTFSARAYTDEPGAAAFLGRSQAGKDYRLTASDLRHPLLIAAADHLRDLGKTNLSWLKAKKGYVSITSDEDPESNDEALPTPRPQLSRWLRQLRNFFYGRD